MGSKYCPKCKNIISTAGDVNFCFNGCGSLMDEPLLPSNWIKFGYVETCKKAQAEYEKREALKNFSRQKIDEEKTQLTLPWL